MTIEEFNRICEDALQKLWAIEKRMKDREKRIDEAFNNFEKAVKELNNSQYVNSQYDNDCEISLQFFIVVISF